MEQVSTRWPSPRGGEVPFDPESLKSNWLSDAGWRFLADSVAQNAIRSTTPLSNINAAHIDAVFLVGGAATTWDFPLNDDIKRIAEQLHDQSKVIAGICHGVVGLTRITDQYGESLLKNRRLTSISNAEDNLMGIDKVVPILPEDMLRKARPFTALPRHLRNMWCAMLRSSPVKTRRLQTCWLEKSLSTSTRPVDCFTAAGFPCPPYSWRRH